MPSRTKSAGTETRGDDPSTSAGRRQIAQATSVRRVSSSSQMSECLAVQEAKAKENDRSAWASLEEKKRKRAKRTGYSHPAAKNSDPDMFAMPDGGISNSAAEKLKKRVDPFLHKDAAAGLDSDKMCEMKDWIGDMGQKKVLPVYFPKQKYDPITHWDMPKSDGPMNATGVQGAAGVRSDRLTKLTQPPWMKENMKKRQSKMHAATVDPIAHTGDPPPKPKGGLRKFEAAHCSSAVNIKHRPGQPEQMDQEAVDKWASRKMVSRGGGEFIYNVAGHEDLLPAATREYTKADKPPSKEHREANDKRWLPDFYRTNSATKENRRIEESDDMHYIMGAAHESPLGLSERQSMISIGSSEGAFRNPHMAASRSQPLLTRSASARRMQQDADREGSFARLRSATPPRRDVTPRRGDTTPRRGDVTPPRSDVTPRRGDVTPQRLRSDVTPRRGDATPPRLRGTPRRGDVTPPRGDLPLTDLTHLNGATPRRRDVTPPRISGSTQRRGNVTPPRGYTPPASYAPSDISAGRAPLGQYSPPRSATSSVVGLDIRSRHVWSSPNEITMGTPRQSDPFRV